MSHYLTTIPEGCRCHYTEPHTDSRSGILGVHQRGSRWVSSIMADGVAVHLGTFDTAEQASDAYQAAKRERHPVWTGCEVDA